jgi:hypothetical protein
LRLTVSCVGAGSGGVMRAMVRAMMAARVGGLDPIRWCLLLDHGGGWPVESDFPTLAGIGGTPGGSLRILFRSVLIPAAVPRSSSDCTMSAPAGCGVFCGWLIA